MNPSAAGVLGITGVQPDVRHRSGAAEGQVAAELRTAEAFDLIDQIARVAQTGSGCLEASRWSGQTCSTSAYGVESGFRWRSPPTARSSPAGSGAHRRHWVLARRDQPGRMIPATHDAVRGLPGSHALAARPAQPARKASRSRST